MNKKNLSSPNRSNQVKEMESSTYPYKESLKIENNSILDDSKLIKNYNNSLKSPQTMRPYKIIENGDHPA